MLRQWSQFVPNMSTDIRGHEALRHHHHHRRRRRLIAHDRQLAFNAAGVNQEEEEKQRQKTKQKQTCGLMTCVLNWYIK